MAETCIDSLTLRELLNLAGKNFEEYMVSLGDIRMTYSHIYGSPNLLKGIASLFQDVKAEQIIPTHGAIGANYQVLITLLEPGDSMVSVAPTYQQHYSIPESMGTEVNILKLLPENNFFVTTSSNPLSFLNLNSAALFASAVLALNSNL